METPKDIIMARLPTTRYSAIKTILAPIIVAVIVGNATSYMAIKEDLAELKTRIIYFENDVKLLRTTAETVNANATELARRSEWMNNYERRIENAERMVDALADATKQIDNLHYKIEHHKH